MIKVPGITGISAPFSVYTIEPESWGKTARAKRFLGCAFPVNFDGLLATCAHVVTSVNSETEMLVVQHPTENVCHRAETVTCHSKHDFALVSIAAKTPFPPTALIGELHLAAAVFAYGYFDTTIHEGSVVLVPNVYSGHITATPRIFRTPIPLKTIFPYYLISFPALGGFSGSPLYCDFNDGCALAGMVFGNVKSETVESFVTEYEDAKNKFVEKSSRVWESGVAHTCDAMKQFADEMKIAIWPAQKA